MTDSIFITGAARGIGAAIAQTAADKGYRVGVFDLDGEAAAETAASLPNASAFQGSVTNAADLEQALDEFGSLLGRHLPNRQAIGPSVGRLLAT